MTFAVMLCAVLSGEAPPEIDEAPRAIEVDPELRRLAETNSTGLEPGAVVAISIGSVAGALALVGCLYWLWSCVKGSTTSGAQPRPAGYQQPAGFTPSGGFTFGATSQSIETNTDMPLLRITMGAPQLPLRR